MAASRPCHGPEIKRRCAELVRQGTPVATICQRLPVSKSYVKRVRAEVEKSRKEASDDED